MHLFLRKQIGFILGPTLLLVACDKDEDKNTTKSATHASETAATVPAASAATVNPAGGKKPKTLAMKFNAAALPKGKLDADKFVEDPCAFAESKDVKAFLTFVEDDVSRQKGERRNRGECVYSAGKPETKVTIWFDSDKQLRSSEEKVELAGLSDVKVRVLSKSASLSLPFPQAKNASKMPADRLNVQLDMYHQNQIPSWDPRYRKPEPKDMRAIVEAIGESLLRRLGLS